MKKVYHSTDITDRALDQVVSDIKQQHPDDGERLLTDHFINANIFVTRTRVRASELIIHTVQQLEVRCVYHVKGPECTLEHRWPSQTDHCVSEMW